MASHEHKVEQPNGRPVPTPIPPTEPAATYALFCRAFRALTLVLIALGVAALVLRLANQPTRLKAHVDAASLARFDLADDGTRLRYDLVVGVSVRNPNRRQAVLYRRLEAAAYYGGDRFGYADLPRMRQRRKSTVEVRPSFRGQAPAVAAATAALFGREKAEGFFNINVKLRTRVRLKAAVVDSVEYRPDVDCYIRVPDPSNATAVALGFTPTQCHVDDFS